MYTSPSLLPRRDPLRLPFPVHIRKLFFLSLSLFSGAPRQTHPVGAGVCPSVCPAVAPFSHPVGAGVLDGPHRFSFMPTAGIFRAPARHPFAHGGPLIFLFYASGGHISFAAERNGAAGGKNLRNRPVPSGTESGGKGVFRAPERGILLSAAGRNGAAGGKKRDGRFKASVSFFFLLMPRNS